jgi:hypothetical protein
MGRTPNPTVGAVVGTAPSHRPGRVGTVVALMLFAACATDPTATEGVGAVQFQDVVVPSGMRLREAGHESYSREAAGWRMGHFVYFGAIDVANAANYVRERMPQHSWAKVRDEEQPEGGQRIQFERGIYTADYTFSRSEGLTVMVVDYATDYTRR